MKSYYIEKRGEYWYVNKKWWRWMFNLMFTRSLFVKGTGPGDERPLGFISKEVAEAAIRKYPDGRLVFDSAFMPDPLLTDKGQRALLGERG